MQKNKKFLLPIITAISILFSGYIPVMADVDLSTIPAYTGEPYVEINDNVPDFPEDDFTTDSFESYSDLDNLGRCGVAYANIGQDLMPTEKRGSIGQVKPSGWHTQIKETDYHVLYRVTPIFDGDNLVADGVQMEAESVEDNGDGILFNVFCYNVQPGINIDYATGVSSLSGESTDVSADTANTEYVLNVNTKKFHKPTCSAAKQMKEENKQEYSGSRDNLITQGYEPCKKCNP